MESANGRVSHSRIALWTVCIAMCHNTCVSRHCHDILCHDSVMIHPHTCDSNLLCHLMKSAVISGAISGHLGQQCRVHEYLRVLEGHSRFSMDLRVQ